MSQIKTLQLKDNRQILVEVSEVEGEVQDVSLKDDVAAAMDSAFEQVNGVIESLSQKIKAIGPEQTQIKFGVKITAGFQAVIVKGGEVNFEVTLTWKNK